MDGGSSVGVGHSGGAWCCGRGAPGGRGRRAQGIIERCCGVRVVGANGLDWGPGLRGPIATDSREFSGLIRKAARTQ